MRLLCSSVCTPRENADWGRTKEGVGCKTWSEGHEKSFHRIHGWRSCHLTATTYWYPTHIAYRYTDVISYQWMSKYVKGLISPGAPSHGYLHSHYLIPTCLSIRLCVGLFVSKYIWSLFYPSLTAIIPDHRILYIFTSYTNGKKYGIAYFKLPWSEFHQYQLVQVLSSTVKWSAVDFYNP